MKTRNILMAFFALLVVGCQPVNEAITNAVYLSDAQSTTSKKIVLDDTGAITVISSRLGNSIATDVVVKYGTDEEALKDYNTKNGTTYKLLPSNFYSFSNQETVIKAGEVSATPVNVIVKPFDETLSTSEKYAIPVTIERVEGGADILKHSSTLVLLLDQIIVTKVLYLSSLNIITLPLEAPFSGFAAWTLEWNVRMDSWNRTNATQWNLTGEVGKSSKVYTRLYGDAAAKQLQLNAPIGTATPASNGRLAEKKWYHLAMTYDGTNIRFYIDGVLDFVNPHTTPGEVFSFSAISFANGVNSSYSLNGQISELRMWSVARSQAEIINNPYVVSFDSPGLEIYWKCNDGLGKTIKDYSGKKRHGVLSKEAKWFDGVRFPDDGK